MGGYGGPGWGGGPGWAIASAPPSMDGNSVSFTDATSIVGTAFAQPSTPVVTSQASTTATIGLMSTSTSSASSDTTDSKSTGSSIAQIAGPVLDGVAGAGLLALLLYYCCRRKGRPKIRLKIKRRTSEDKENRRMLREAEAIAAEREKALRDLENRRRERETQPQSFMGGFDFGALGNDRGHAKGVETVPKHAASPRSPRWI